MENKISCVIIDDEPLAVDLIKDYASKFPFLKIILATTKVFEAIKIMHEQQVDLVFIDIQMPELSGIEFMDMFNQQHCFIITSAYQDYALASYDFQVVDYLLKPITLNRFSQSIEKLKKWKLNFCDITDVSDAIIVKSNGKLIKLQKTDILYVEGLKDYVQLVLHTGDKYIVYSTMKNMDEILQPTFVRTHKSYLVAKKAMTILEGNQIITPQKKIPIGESYKAIVLAIFHTI